MKHTITNRILIGKIIGIIVGLSFFFVALLLKAPLDLRLGVGLVLFYAFMGVVIAFMGMFERHPVLNFKMPWWFHGIVVGAIMHLMLVLLCYNQLIVIIKQMDIWGLVSPWWILIDGAILGLVMSFFQTKFAGEGMLPIK